MFKHGDEELAHYVKLRDFKYYMVYIMDFPFSVPVPNILEMKVNKILFSPLKNCERYLVLFSDRYWSKSIDVPGREIVSVKMSPYSIDESIEYEQQSTRCKLVVQILEEEISGIQKIFRDSSFRCSLLVRLLSIFEFKLIEIKGFSFGSEYINYGADRVFLFKYDDSVDCSFPVETIVTCNYLKKDSHKLEVGSDHHLCCDDLCMWRYYANKCEIAFNRKQNSDCVLFAAISIESYIHDLLIKNELLQRFDEIKNKDSKLLAAYKKGDMSEKEFLKAINDKSERNFSDSVFGETDFLFENGAVCEKEMKLIKKSLFCTVLMKNLNPHRHLRKDL